jgi:predicted nucleic acid-binding protein
MTPVLVDSNVIIDIAEADPRWHAWSAATLAALADSTVLVINPIIYAEVSIGFTSPDELEAAIGTDIFRREPLPWEAAFVAGRTFLLYRRRGGTRRSPLPDFFIGAHAAVLRYRLLTRDPGRYRAYFPTVELIAP